jgi:hypothetical protein
MVYTTQPIKKLNPILNSGGSNITKIFVILAKVVIVSQNGIESLFFLIFPNQEPENRIAQKEKERQYYIDPCSFIMVPLSPFIFFLFQSFFCIQRSVHVITPVGAKRWPGNL